LGAQFSAARVAKDRLLKRDEDRNHAASFVERAKRFAEYGAETAVPVLGLHGVAGTVGSG
jgi:hypothetical protein